MNQICDSLGDADPEEMEALMEELGNNPGYPDTSGLLYH